MCWSSRCRPGRANGQSKAVARGRRRLTAATREEIESLLRRQECRRSGSSSLTPAQRAAIEPRFSELKEDLAADDFCLQKFFPTEAAVLSVLFVFNLLSILQALDPKTPGVQQRPATLRHSLFLCGAVVGRSRRTFSLLLSSAWGGLASRKPLLDKIRAAVFSTSPKLDSAPATAPP